MTKTGRYEHRQQRGRHAEHDCPRHRNPRREWEIKVKNDNEREKELNRHRLIKVDSKKESKKVTKRDTYEHRQKRDTQIKIKNT